MEIAHLFQEKEKKDGEEKKSQVPL